MKKWIKSILLISAFVGACALSFYDTANKSGFIAFAAWVCGSYILIRQLKPCINRKIESLRQSEGSNDYICAFISVGVALAVIAVVAAVGFVGKFDFNTCLHISFRTDSFFSYVLESALINAILILVLMLVISVLQILPTTLLGFHADSDFCGNIAKYSVYFIVLSQCCGIIDMIAFLSLLGSAWSAIMG